MEGQESLANFDSLLLQLVLQTRELSQKKDEINQQITMTKATITESKSCIETTKSILRKREEEICQKQNVVKHFKSNAKSMKATNSLLHQYEKTLQSEIERREDNCNQDMKAYQERIESYKQVFQKHKEHYCQSPLAKKLLLIQSEKEEIECRIKACDKQMILKQKELDDLYGHTGSTFPIVNSIESVSDGLNTEEPEKEPDHHTDDLHLHVNISSLHLTLPKIIQDSHDNFGEGVSGENREESTGRDTPVHPSSQGDACGELWSNPESMEQQRPVEVSSADQDKGSVLQVQEEHPVLPSLAVEMEEEEERRAVDEEQAAFINDEDENEGVSAFNQSSLPSRTCPQSSPARSYPPQTSPSRMKAVSTTPTFSLHSSPSSSPSRRETSDDKSPAFLFAMNSTPSTPGFSGFNFGFEMGSAQEDSPFTFTSSYFSGKKPLESKSPSGFPFDQSERSEDDFEFSFGGKSPKKTSTSPEKTSASPEKGGDCDAFPFSFNFGKF